MKYQAIGLMSGSSLDGLDIAHCRFETGRENGQFEISEWEILAASTFPFSAFWKKRLRDLPTGTAFELAEAHAAFGAYMGQLVRQFFASQNLAASQIDLIASHGHTVFHEPAPSPPQPPKRGGARSCPPPFGGLGGAGGWGTGAFTTQIGDGTALAVATGCRVISDFRTADVALGGQGAPLAPIADRHLLPEADFYLNLGGIANLTCDAAGKFIAFDVTGVNQILNAVTKKHFGLPYDDNGELARSGVLDVSFLEKLNAPSFFDLPYPKSLSNQWVMENLVALALATGAPPENILHTTCRHVGVQLAKSISQIIENEGFVKQKYRLIPTGGGVFNSFLMDCIRAELPNVEITVPEKNIVDFKEAALMALMGVMNLERVPNCMASVTGASRDAIGGVVILKG